MSPIDLDRVRAALALDGFDAADARRQMAPQPRALRRSDSRAGSPRQASVMILLYPLDERLGMVLVQRSKNERDVHSVQIALPGGAREGDETYLASILPDARQSLDLVNAGYRAGEFDYLAVLTAQRTYFSVNLDYLQSL